MTILVLDPGGTTGWALFKDGRVTAGDFPNWSQVAHLIEFFKPEVIVAESFYLYLGKARQLSGNTFVPAEVLGVIKYLGETWNIPVKLIHPSAKKGFPLRKGAVHGSQHARDAARIGLAYLDQAGLRGYEALLA